MGLEVGMGVFSEKREKKSFQAEKAYTESQRFQTAWYLQGNFEILHGWNVGCVGQRKRPRVERK